MLRSAVCLAVVLVLTFAASGQELAEVVELWPGGAPGAVGKEQADRPDLTVYLAPEETATGAAVVIFPGGGYGHLAMDHEGHDVARWLNGHGVSAFILRYRHAPDYRHPIPLGDAQRAIRLVRTRAVEWGVDPNRLGVLGFSAGGHLASTTGTRFDAGRPDHADPVEHASSRPDFLILGYPVISFTTDYTHQGSRRNLLGEDPDPELVRSLSSELQVTPETPPTFLVHTTEDAGVPPENSILFYRALREAGVPAELHIYERGRHGLGLGPPDLAFSSWPDRCIAWLKARGVVE